MLDRDGMTCHQLMYNDVTAAIRSVKSDPLGFNATDLIDDVKRYLNECPSTVFTLKDILHHENVQEDVADGKENMDVFLDAIGWELVAPLLHVIRNCDTYYGGDGDCNKVIVASNDMLCSIVRICSAKEVYLALLEFEAAEDMDTSAADTYDDGVNDERKLWRHHGLTVAYITILCSVLLRLNPKVQSKFAIGCLPRFSSLLFSNLPPLPSVIGVEVPSIVAKAQKSVGESNQQQEQEQLRQRQRQRHATIIIERLSPLLELLMKLLSTSDNIVDTVSNCVLSLCPMVFLIDNTDLVRDLGAGEGLIGKLLYLLVTCNISPVDIGSGNIFDDISEASIIELSLASLSQSDSVTLNDPTSIAFQWRSWVIEWRDTCAIDYERSFVKSLHLFSILMASAAADITRALKLSSDLILLSRECQRKQFYFSTEVAERCFADLQVLASVAASSPEHDCRLAAFNTLRCRITAFTPEARFNILSFLLSSCPYPVLAALLVHLVKEEVNYAYSNSAVVDVPPNVFASPRILFVLPLCLLIDNVGMDPRSLLEERHDILLSGLNFYRHLLLVDRPCGKTGVWDPPCILDVRHRFLAPLSVLLKEAILSEQSSSPRNGCDIVEENCYKMDLMRLMILSDVQDRIKEIIDMHT